MAESRLLSSPNIFEIPDRADEFATRFPEQVRTMLAMLRMSDLGGLAVAECNDVELRRQLFVYFKDRLADEDIYLFPYEVSEKNLNLVQALRDLTEQPRFKNLEFTGKFKSIVIFVYGIEKYGDAQEAHFLYLLNFLRDAFTTIEQPVVIWGTSDFVTRLARSAPDFWSWKGMLFSFPSGLPDYSTDEPVNAQVGELRARLQPLPRYLQGVLEDPDYAVWKDLYLPLKAVRAADTPQFIAPRHTFTEEEMAQLQQAITQIESYPAEEIIFECGATGDTCYVIVAGEVEVLAPDALGNEIPVSTLGPGDFFGEIALLESIPRTAKVVTTQPSRFLVLNRRLLGTVSRVAPSVLEVLMDISQRRLEARLRDPQELVSPLRRFALEGQSLIRQTPEDVSQLIADDQYVVVLGEAGAGKTTVLRRMMLDLASDAAQALARPGGKAVIPFFLKLNMLSPDRRLEDLVLETLHSYGILEFESKEELTDLLMGRGPHARQVGGFVFLMDGLNEMSSLTAVRHDVSRFIQEYSRHRFVMACRVRHYAPIVRFRTVMLQRLAGDDIETFLTGYLGADRGRRLARDIHSDPQLKDLAQTPLALYMFAQIAKSSQAALPKNRGVLFGRFADNLLERTDTEWWKIFGRSKSRVPLTIRRATLASLGLTMQENEVWAVSRTRWMSIVAHVLYLYREAATSEEREATRTVLPQDVMEEIMYSGLLRYSGDRELVEFAHHTLQEFFAALALRNQGADLEPLLDTDEGRRQWSGTTVLLYGISRHKAELLLKVLGRGNDYSRLWLSAECLANAGDDISLAADSLEAALPEESSLDETQRFGMLFSLGLACRQLGRYPNALAYLNRAAELKAGSADVQYELGSLYRLVDQYDRAIAHLEEAIRLRPDFVDAYNQLGITYYDQQKYVEALTVFRATTQLEPSNPYHFYNLGTVLKLLRDYPAARNAFQQAVERKPGYLEARTQLDILDKALTSGVIRMLDRIPMLSKLTLEQNVLLANRLRVVRFEPGEIVFHVGEMGDTFYIIEAGNVEVLAPDATGSPGVLNRLGPGDIFGEIALLRAVPRTATVRVVSPSLLLTLSREDFDDVLVRYPSVAHRLAETSIERLLRDRQRVNRTDLDRYYDPAYIEELVQQEEVTVVMGDIHGSTFLTNTIGPEVMVEFLDEYLTCMSSIVVQAGGALDRSLGDSVMGVFGSFQEGHSESETSSADRALLAAIDMRKAYLDLRAEWSTENAIFEQTGMGIGLSTGSVAIGTVGSETAMVGSAVNLANKLSKLVVNGRQESEIYVDERTNELLCDAIIADPVDPALTSRQTGGVFLKAYHIIQQEG
jgi:CRP-like cAMP-binding protein/Flp pilus assembly protein TadD